MAFSFLDFAKNIVKVTVALGTFFLFGYTELEYKCGFLVAVLVGLYLFRSGARVVPALLVVGNLASSYFGVKPLSVLTFLALLCMIFYIKYEAADDTKVVLRPYESEVRSILFRHDPSLLHTVDRMLDEHLGREKELIYKLNTQYSTPKKGIKSPAAKTPHPQYNPMSEREEIQSTLAEAGSSKSNTTSAPSIRSEVGSPTSGGSTGNSYATTVLKIKNILRRSDPALYASVDRMLAEYEGHEGDLLREIIDEFGDDGNGNSSGTPLNPSYNTAHAQSASGSVQYEEFDHGLSVATGGSAFTSPNSAYTAGHTPADVYSVASEYPSQAQRRNPFSPTVSDRFPAVQRGHYIFGESQDSRDSYNNGTNRYEVPELASPSMVSQPHAQHTQRPQAAQWGDTHRQSTTAGTAHSYTAGSSNAAQIRSAVAQAQEEARREMQARIDARYGAKPANSGAAGSSGVQKRHSYAYPG